MRFQWLHQQNSRDCILFFAGWGMGPEPFQSLPANDCSLLLVYDYSSLVDIDFRVLQEYERVHLLAWSLGVWVAATLLNGRRQSFSSTTAMGGTLSPIDAEHGIKPEIFSAMIESWSPTTLFEFYRSMFDNEKHFKRFLRHRPARSEETLREELMSLQKAIRENGPAQDIFDRKIVLSRDRVFPPRHQRKAWGKDQCTPMKWPHFPFYETDARFNLLTLP